MIKKVCCQLADLMNDLDHFATVLHFVRLRYATDVFSFQNTWSVGQGPKKLFSIFGK